MTDAADRVRTIIIKHFEKVALLSQVPFDPSRVVDEANLFDDLGGDSLDILEIVIDIEDQFERDFPKEQTDRLRTGGDLVALV